MKRRMTFLTLASVIAVSALSVVIIARAQGPAQPATPGIGTDSNPAAPPFVDIPAKFQAPSVSATSVTGTSVYFTPQDENTSATVLFLYNTNGVDKTVGLRSFYTNGSLTIDTTIVVPAHGLVRICSDTVTTVSASWQDVVLVNFTTFSAYAELILPAGVKAEGYVVYDPTGVYDPLAEAPMLPLRFSVRRPTVP